MKKLNNVTARFLAVWNQNKFYSGLAHSSNTECLLKSMVFSKNSVSGKCAKSQFFNLKHAPGNQPYYLGYALNIEQLR